MIIQLNTLRLVAPNNVNRDKDGYPKTQQFCGTTRAMCSGASLKHAGRSLLQQVEVAHQLDTALRTTALPEMVQAEIRRQDGKMTEPDVEAIGTKICRMFAKAEVKSKGEDKAEQEKEPKGRLKTQSQFFSAHVPESIAKMILSLRRDQPKEFQVWLLGKSNEFDRKLEGVEKDRISMERLLYGSCSMSGFIEEIESCTSFSPSIGVGEAKVEQEYFVCYDDYRGTGGFISSDEGGRWIAGGGVHYSYGMIHVDQFFRQGSLHGKKPSEMLDFLRYWLEVHTVAWATGMKANYATFDWPQLVLLELFDTPLPQSHHGAFEVPVEGPNMMQTACRRLQDHLLSGNQYFQKAQKGSLFSPPRRLYFKTGNASGFDLGNSGTLFDSFSEMCDKAVEEAREHCFGKGQ